MTVQAAACHGRPLSGDLLVEGQFQPVETDTDASGFTWGRSPLPGLDFCWYDGRLRFYDPAPGVYLLYERETAVRAAADEEEIHRLREELRQLRGE